MAPVESKARPAGWTLKDARAADKQGWDLCLPGFIDRAELNSLPSCHNPDMYDRVVELAKAGDKTAAKALALVVKIRLER